jgi:hypothetical protein
MKSLPRQIMKAALFLLGVLAGLLCVTVLTSMFFPSLFPSTPTTFKDIVSGP